jgi:hypothetical protein
VRGNVEYFEKLGGYDAQQGKLLETLTPEGSRAICESYIDNGHPYWGMQAFALWLIPKNRPFWTAKEELLPVEKRSFAEPLRGPKILLAGDKGTGEVRWMIAVNGHNDPEYRPKYSKFTYSTGHPWGTGFDSVLLFRDPLSGQWAGQAGIDGGRLIENGYERRWWARIGEGRVTVESTIAWDGKIEKRRHRITAPAGIEFVEGSPAYAAEPNRSLVKAAGYDDVRVEEQRGANIVHGRSWVFALKGKTKEGMTDLTLRISK